MENLISDAKGIFAERRLKLGKGCGRKCRPSKKAVNLMNSVFGGKTLNNKV